MTRRRRVRRTDGDNAVLVGGGPRHHSMSHQSVV
jgi:hypothetical protein